MAAAPAPQPCSQPASARLGAAQRLNRGEGQRLTTPAWPRPHPSHERTNAFRVAAAAAGRPAAACFSPGGAAQWRPQSFLRMIMCTARRPQNPSLRGRSMQAGFAAQAVRASRRPGTDCPALAAPSPMLLSFYPLSCRVMPTPHAPFRPRRRCIACPSCPAGSCVEARCPPLQPSPRPTSLLPPTWPTADMPPCRTHVASPEAGPAPCCCQADASSPSVEAWVSCAC